MSRFIVFDVDGTLMDLTHRRKFLETQPKDWDSFNDPDTVMKDTPIDEVFMLARILQNAGFLIVVSSGRKKKLRDITLKQLSDQGLIPSHSFFRSDTDFRPDAELKKQHLANMIEEFGEKPTMVFDDRDSVVDMWRSEGIKTFQPERGNF